MIDLSSDARAALAVVAAGLLLAGGGTLEFAHPLYRAAALEVAGPDAVRRSHAVLAAAAWDRDPQRHAWHRGLSVLGVDEGAAANMGGQPSSWGPAQRAWPAGVDVATPAASSCWARAGQPRRSMPSAPVVEVATAIRFRGVRAISRQPDHVEARSRAGPAAEADAALTGGLRRCRPSPTPGIRR